MAADSGYMQRESTGNERGRIGRRFQTWDTSSTPQEGWSSTPTVITPTNQYTDHLRRPIVVDPDDTTRPGVVILPYQQKTEAGIITKVETVVERVYPSSNAYNNRYSTTYEWSKPERHYEDQTSKFNEFITNVQTAASGSSRTGFSGGGLFQSRPNNLNGYGGSGTNEISPTNPWSKPSGVTNDIGTTSPWSSRPSGGTNDNVSNPWSRPSGGTYDNVSNPWSKPGGGTNDTGSNPWSRPSGGTYDTASNPRSKPSGNPIRQPFYDGSYDKDEAPTMTTTDGWGRPRPAPKAPPSYESTITKPTSDVGAAVDYVRESARPSSAATMAPRQGRFSASSPTYPMKEPTVEAIDSEEAKRKYSNSSVSPAITNNPNVPTIDSKEAVRKYNGLFV